ncbi:hypothetical protein AVEN_163008-1 [Araneus ventricosus]|uniref:Uncharacterized protein n=1 Tax=Araneus ventricosus TaxID=182803 RepID=A0A4Y2BZH9_ARAVE|nr:hypothetical protein AVEN_163008-1 [Araneus ventricosus]
MGRHVSVLTGIKRIHVKDSYPLPRIDDTLDALNGSQCLTLDLKVILQQRSNLKIKERQPYHRTGLQQFKYEGIGAALRRLETKVCHRYFSKSLSQKEIVSRKELLAILKSIEHFHHYYSLDQRLQEYDFEIQHRREPLKKCRCAL